ncbi:hypothetical protein [Novosphingobium sp.]|uniref:hypothetical protein n=1 Tax=Novosphingobium sp. TaxID=1874826 RepID=UPI002B49CE4D|nr:hypothetical protein [Novosphingobium sp.]HKR90791.1 hypothetical protein [Novosphingobium sp.]
MNERIPEPEVWAANLRDFAHRCIGSSAADEADRVREAMLLLRGVVGSCGSRWIDAAALEPMLACGATESAVLAIFGPDVAFMVSRGKNGCSLATVIVSDGGDEVMSEGETPALALLAAYSGALLSDIECGGGAWFSFPGPASRSH